MEYMFKIKEISPEPIVVRKSNKFVSRLPRLTMDKEGRLVLLTDNLKRFINNSKTLLFALFFLGVLDASSQEYADNSIQGGKHAEWKTFTKAAEPGNEPDIEGSAYGLLLKQLTPGAIVISTGNIYHPSGTSKFIISDNLEGELKDLVLQIWTTGVPADYGSFELKAGDVSLKGSRSEVASGDAGVISKINFDLDSSEINSTSYSISFNASGAHMSLVSVRLDFLEEVGEKPLAFKKHYSSNSEFAEWETFTVGFGDPGNDADVEGSKVGPTITQSTPGAMATGSGNIYNPAGVSKFSLSDNLNGKLKDINFQIWTKGSPADYESFVLKTPTENFVGKREEIVSRDGSTISNIAFDTSSSVLENVSYSIEFSASAAHMSLAAARLDISYEEEIIFEFKDVLASDSEYAEWKDFTNAFGDPGNEADVRGSKSGVLITQTTPGAMVTSTKNIYNPGGVSKFTLKDNFLGKLDKMVFQIWTVCSPANYESFRLVSGDNNISGERTELVNGDRGVISLIDFNLEGQSIQDTEFTIEFEASGPHMSLTAARLDYEVKDIIINYDEYTAPGWSFDGWVNFEHAVAAWNEPDLEGSREVTFDEGSLLRQVVEGAMITSTKNIYSPRGISAFEISDATTEAVVDVALQIRTTGSPLNNESVILKIGENSIKGEYSEVARKRTRYGYELISKFDFDLEGQNTNEYTIEFSASGPHMSLVSARLDRQTSVSYQLEKSYSANLDEVSDDRWTYPRNSTPGKRNLAPVFGFASGEGDERMAQRYGQMIVGFDTSSDVPLGLHYSQYKIKSLVMNATVALDQQFPYDGTADDYSKYNGVDDKDSPVELFGAGFRNGYDSLSWNETSPLSDRNDNANHHVYSLGFDNGKAIDVDYYSFSNPHNAKPFAIGKVDGLEQGDMVPEDSVFEFNVDVSDKNIHHYVADSLSKGKIFFALSQILYGKTADGGKGYPDFYTSDHILGEGPTLKIEFEIVPAKLEPPIMSIKRNGKGGVVLEWSGVGELQSSDTLGMEAEWISVETTENKHEIDSNELQQFYRVKGL